MTGRIADHKGAQRLTLLLPQLSEQLSAGLLSIEPGFETLGHTLYSVSADCDQLLKGIKSSQGDADIDPVFGQLYDVDKIVKESLEVAWHCKNNISGSLDIILACSDYLARSACQEQNIAQNSAIMHATGVNVRGSNSPGTFTRAVFNGYENEIKALVAKLDDTISAIHTDTHQADTQQQSENLGVVFSKGAESIEPFGLLVSRAKETVEYTIEQLHTTGDQATAAREKASDHFLKISGIVSEIVVAVQYHDIARQQIEHIVSGMEDILSILQIPEQIDSHVWENEEQKKGGAYFILTIQAAQLELILTQARKVYKDIDAALTRISKETARLLSDVAGKKENYGYIGTRFHFFQAQIENFYALFVDINKLESVMSESLKKASPSLSYITDSTVRDGDMNADLRSRAFNSVIRADKTGCKGCPGPGRVYENGSGVFVSACAGSGGPKGDCLGRISTVLSESESRWTKTAELARGILKKLDQAKLHLGFFSGWIHECEHILKSLDSLVRRLSPWKESALDLPSGVRLDIAGRYTMESERKIYNAMVLKDGAPEQPAVALDDSDNKTDSDDNIELF